MRLADLLNREPARPWAHGGKLPWRHPAFSGRMLDEHLSQHHDRASRRVERIDRQVEWIHNTVLRGEPGRVLDLGCGPGLYTARLAMRGHSCVGIDFSPAAIAHARSEAERRGLPCDYRLRDLRDRNLGRDFQAALFISGEFNTFPPAEARTILDSAYRALAPSGALVLEVHTEDFVRELGMQSPTWFAAPRGLFSEQPHLCLRECTWHAGFRATVERYFVIEAASGEMATYASTTQAYAYSEYRSVVQESGFERFDHHPSLEGAAATSAEGLFVLIAWREAA